MIFLDHMHISSDNNKVKMLKKTVTDRKVAVQCLKLKKNPYMHAYVFIFSRECNLNKLELFLYFVIAIKVKWCILTTTRFIHNRRLVICDRNAHIKMMSEIF